MKDQSINAWNYVNDIDHKLWSYHAFVHPRFGHDTNNITESVNFQWADIRKLPPLQMMDSIYTWLMNKVYERHHRNQRSTAIADVPLSKFNDRLLSSRKYRVSPSGNGMYQVQIPDSEKKFIVNLKEYTCNCTFFQEYVSPCTHAIAASRYEAEDPYKLFAEEYTVPIYRKMYMHFLRPFNIENLSAANVLPPVFKKQHGRPTTKRIRKGDWKRKETKCSKCKGPRHNIRKCKFAPAINGRQQRARGRELSVSSSSSGGSNSGLDSNTDEEALRDQMESALYHKQIARAWEIVNRRQQEREREEKEYIQEQEQTGKQESDSELSIIASSLFDSIEGDAEMGGM